MWAVGLKWAVGLEWAARACGAYFVGQRLAFDIHFRVHSMPALMCARALRDVRHDHVGEIPTMFDSLSSSESSRYAWLRRRLVAASMRAA